MSVPVTEIFSKNLLDILNLLSLLIPCKLIINIYKSKVDDFVNSLCDQSEYTYKVDITVMNDCVYELKNNKAAGYDGICNEHNKYGGAQLLDPSRAFVL